MKHCPKSLFHTTFLGAEVTIGLNIVMNVHQYDEHLSPPSGGRGPEHEPVPSVLVLPGPAGSLFGLHGALFPVPKIHQAEVQPRLVNQHLWKSRASSGPVLHKASLHKWREGSRSIRFDTELSILFSFRHILLKR